jgi:hypothetical protein
MPKREKKRKRNAENDDHAEAKEEKLCNRVATNDKGKYKVLFISKCYYLGQLFNFLFLARGLGSCSLF